MMFNPEKRKTVEGTRYRNKCEDLNHSLAFLCRRVSGCNVVNSTMVEDFPSRSNPSIGIPCLVYSQ